MGNSLTLERLDGNFYHLQYCGSRMTPSMTFNNKTMYCFVQHKDFYNKICRAFSFFDLSRLELLRYQNLFNGYLFFGNSLTIDPCT